MFYSNAPLMSGQGLKIPKCAMQLLWSFGEYLASVFCALQSFVFYRHSSYRSKHPKYTRCSCCECLASAVQFLNSSGHCIHIWYFTKTCPTDARPGVKIPRDGRCNCCGQVSNISPLPSLHLMIFIAMFLGDLTEIVQSAKLTESLNVIRGENNPFQKIKLKQCTSCVYLKCNLEM